MANIVCECGHSIDEHCSSGCLEVVSADNEREYCACVKTPNQIVEPLQAENEKFRKALREIAYGGWGISMPGIATEALGEQNNG